MSKRNQREKHNIDEECQDKACSDTQAQFKSWMKKRPECPLDRAELGRNTWSLLHTIAAKYPMRPSVEEKNDMKEFIRLMSILYPCSFCAKEFRDDLKKMPPELDSRKTLSLWFCKIHNRVNEKLYKPQFDCTKVDERWRTGWKDGSCF